MSDLPRSDASASSTTVSTALRRWATLGLGTTVAATALVACNAPEPSEPQAPSATAPSQDDSTTMIGMGEMGESGEGEGGETGHSMDTLPLPKRLAFMTGHVEAGLALYRAGEPGMAARHLLHPVSETHAAEREGLDQLGFDGALFEEVSKALEADRPASEIEPQLRAAEENLAMVADRAGGDTAEIIRYLMDVVAEEYTIAITDGQVSDPGEYQDAYGFTVVAKDRALTLDTPPAGLIEELDALLALWPASPIPPADPTPVGQVLAQASKVALTLN